MWLLTCHGFCWPASLLGVLSIRVLHSSVWTRQVFILQTSLFVCQSEKKTIFSLCSYPPTPTHTYTLSLSRSLSYTHTHQPGKNNHIAAGKHDWFKVVANVSTHTCSRSERKVVLVLSIDRQSYLNRGDCIFLFFRAIMSCLWFDPYEQKVRVLKNPFCCLPRESFL